MKDIAKLILKIFILHKIFYAVLMIKKTINVSITLFIYIIIVPYRNAKTLLQK